MIRTNGLAAAGLAAAGWLCRLSGLAQDCPAIDPPPVMAPASCPAVDPIRTVGLRIFVDRRTGRLRAPTPEEARALYESGGRGLENLEPLEIVVHPDGMRSVDLKGAFAFDVVLRRGPDGSVVVRCLPPGDRPQEK